LAVYTNFAEHLECHIVICDRFCFDLCVGTRFLAHELVAWEGEDFKSSFPVFIVEADKLSVMGLGLTSAMRYIDDEQ